MPKLLHLEPEGIVARDVEFAAALPVGATIDSAAPVAFAGQTWLDHGVGFSDYLRATYPGLAALHPFGPPAEQLEPMNIPRGGFQAIAANFGPTPVQWFAVSNTYALGAVMVPATRTGYVYTCIQGGTIGGAEPTWPTTPGQTVNDGSVIWRCDECVILACSNSTATGNCIAVSRDNGKTWKSYPAPAALTSVTHAGGSTWLACDGTSAAVYRSTDDGASWVKISTPGQAVMSVAADYFGNAIAILGTGSTTWLKSTNGGETWIAHTNTIVGANGFAAVVAEIAPGNTSATVFCAITSTGVTVQISATAGTATTRATATGMNQLTVQLADNPLAPYIIASASAGTTTPLWVLTTSWKTSGAFSNWQAAPAACRNYRYAKNGLIGFSNTNAGTALYFYTGSAWNTLTVAAYGIGISSCQTADVNGNIIVIASTNPTAANTASNLTRARSTGFDTSGGHAGIPHAGATSFAFGEISGKMFACNTGANTIQQLLVNDGSGWRTQVAPNGLASLANQIFDLGNNVGVIVKGSNNILRTDTANADNPTWASVAVFANFLLHDEANTVTVVWDSGSGVRRSVTRMATFPTISNPTALTLAGFTFRGHGIVFDGAYWFPGNDVQGRAAFAKSTDLGLTWSIESTELENSQFDFLATSGTEAVALCKASGVVWTRTIGGAWKQASEGSIAQGVGVWVDLLWCSGRGQYIALSSTNWSYSPLAASVDGERWEPCGNQITGALLGRLGYSPTLDQLFASTAAASNTPILSEIKTFDKANLFRLYQQRGKGQSIRTYSRAS